jgi:transcriptional regulator GlxA family with amidase domain
MVSELISTRVKAPAWTVGIVLFDGVEILDFAGPFQVFHAARLDSQSSGSSSNSPLFQVFTLARSQGLVRVSGGLLVKPHLNFENTPPIEILVIPGGQGTRPLLADEYLLDWIRGAASEATVVASVCTGALLLAKAGLLKGRRATTHWGALDLLASIDPTIIIDPASRVVDDVIVTSAGISAGIDLALCLVERLCGSAVADHAARHIEYRDRWKVSDQRDATSGG